jgi:hypothetical protein
MSTTRVFNDELISSLCAVMVFPNDMLKAAPYAAWMLVNGSKAREEGDVETFGVERLHRIALAAAARSETQATVRQAESRGALPARSQKFCSGSSKAILRPQAGRTPSNRPQHM